MGGNYPDGITSHQYRQQFGTDTDAIEEREREIYYATVVNYNRLADALAELLIERLRDELVYEVAGGESAYRAMTREQREALVVPEVKVAPFGLASSLCAGLDAMFGDGEAIARVGALLDVWPSFESWQQSRSIPESDPMDPRI